MNSTVGGMSNKESSALKGNEVKVEDEDLKKPEKRKADTNDKNQEFEYHLK